MEISKVFSNNDFIFFGRKSSSPKGLKEREEEWQTQRETTMWLPALHQDYGPCPETQQGSE